MKAGSIDIVFHEVDVAAPMKHKIDIHSIWMTDWTDLKPIQTSMGESWQSALSNNQLFICGW